jgi:hypothetical protein
LPPSCADCHEIWEPQPPGTLRACPGLYWDCFLSSSISLIYYSTVFLHYLSVSDYFNTTVAMCHTFSALTNNCGARAVFKWSLQELLHLKTWYLLFIVTTKSETFTRYFFTSLEVLRELLYVLYRVVIMPCYPCRNETTSNFIFTCGLGEWKHEW